MALFKETRKMIRQSIPTNSVMKSLPEVDLLKYQKNMEKNIINIDRFFKVRLSIE